MCDEVQYGREEYRQTVALRDEVLRKPLGLKFTPAELAKDEGCFHLACRRDGKLVGCLVLEPRADGTAYLRQLAVSATWQGRGIGRALVGFSESFAARHGFGEIAMHARETALGFYEKMGYRKEGDRFVETTVPHFVMRKRLRDGGAQPEPPNHQ